MIASVELGDYLAAFKVTYREQPAQEAYSRYHAKGIQDSEDPDLVQAWLHTLPIIRVVFRYEFPSRTGKEPEFNREDLESVAASSLFNALLRRRIPPFPERFTNWCFKDVKYRFIDTVRENRRGTVPRGHVTERHHWHQGGLFNTSRYVELKDFAESIPHLTRVFVLQRIEDRFQGTLYKRAANYVIDRLGLKERPNLRILQNYYGIPKPEFWIDLVVVLLRESLYNIRAKYGDLLYGSSMEYIYDYVEGMMPMHCIPDENDEDTSDLGEEFGELTVHQSHEQ